MTPRLPWQVRIIRIFRLIKLARLLRASRMFTRWQTKIAVPYADGGHSDSVTFSPTAGRPFLRRYSYQAIIRTLIMVLTLSHWCACFWGLQVAFQDTLELSWMGSFGYCARNTTTTDDPAAQMALLASDGQGYSPPSLPHIPADNGPFIVTTCDPWNLYVGEADSLDPAEVDP